MSAAAKQDIRGWKALKPMPQGSRYAHGCCEVDKHRMIIVGGENAYAETLSSGMIYDARTELWTPLPNDMPEPLHSFGIAGNDKYVFVIGGMNARDGFSNTVYRLSLETYKWTTMALMGTARRGFAAVRKGDYIYVFGGNSDSGSRLAERYSILNNIWESLPDMVEARCSHYAIAGSGDDIYIVGGDIGIDSLEIFDTASFLCETEATSHEIPGRMYAVVVLLKDQYLVMIGGLNDDCGITAGCLVYDIWSKHWSVTPLSMDMITPRDDNFTAIVLDGKIVVSGGSNGGRRRILSSEYIGVDDLLEYAPLHYPLPSLVFNRILEIGRADGDSGSRPSAGDVDESLHKKAKTIQSNYGET